jgi:hypothetical protein
MTFHVPQTVADNLFEDIEQWIDLDETPDELSLQKLERLASALAKVEPALASIAKSAIAVIRWDFEQADRWAKNAMLLDSSPIILLNVALTYKLLNRLDLAADVGRVLYSKAPKDADVVNAALGYLTWGGHLHDVNRICAEAQGNGVALLADNEDMTAYTDCMGELGISTERLIFEVNAAYQVLAENKKRVRGVKFEEFVDHDSNSSLVLMFGFNGDIGDEMRLESELAKKLVEVDGWNPEILSTEFEYVDINVHNPA